MRARILDAADRLFYGTGIRAIGVDSVAAEAGISKRTLYNHFPSKDALIQAYLERRSVPLPAPAGDPLAEVMAAFDRLEETFRDPRFRGCPFVNAVSEVGEGSEDVQRLALAFKRDRHAWVRDRLAAAGIRDAAAIATRIRLLIEGAIATMLVSGDPAIARDARAAAVTLLEAAGARAAPKRKRTVGARRR